MAMNPPVIYKMISMKMQPHQKCLMSKQPQKLCCYCPQQEEVKSKGILNNHQLDISELVHLSVLMSLR